MDTIFISTGQKTRLFRLRWKKTKGKLNLTLYNEKKIISIKIE